MEDHIVDEVRRVREEHAAMFNYDFDAIFADLKRLESEGGRSHVSFAPRRVTAQVPSQVQPTASATK